MFFADLPTHTTTLMLCFFLFANVQQSKTFSGDVSPGAVYVLADAVSVVFAQLAIERCVV